jgi:cation diffusion facilitator family transporter
MNSNREKVIVRTSIISIILNIVLVGFKALVGIFANSIAIVSDAINNLSDVISSIIAIAGNKFAAKEPDKNHPYGHGRIEYMASFVISAVIIYVGITAFIESLKKNNKA